MEISDGFKAMVNDLQAYAETTDPELLDSMEWIKNEAKKRGITKDEMVFIVLQKYDAEKKAEKWRERITEIKTIKSNCCENCQEPRNNGYNYCPKCGVLLT